MRRTFGYLARSRAFRLRSRMQRPSLNFLTARPLSGALPPDAATPDMDAGLGSNDWFQRLADAAPTPMWITDRSGATVYVNRPWLVLTGRLLDDERGGGWNTALHPEDRTRVWETFQTALIDRAGVRLLYRVRRADGAFRWLDSIGTPRFDADGAFQGYVGLCIDVTERHESVVAFENYCHAVRESGQILFQWSAVANRLTFPQGESSVFGHPVRQLTSLEDWLQRVSADDRARLAREIEQGLRAGTAFASEYRFIAADGTAIPVRARGALVRNHAGDVVSIVGFLVDLRDEYESRRLVETHAAVLANLSEAVTVTNDAGTILYANAAAAEMFGYTAVELVGLDVRELNSDPRSRKEEILTEMLRAATSRGRWTGELNSIRRDGSRFISRAVVAPFVYGGERSWVLVQRDVTERKRLEAAVADVSQREQGRIATELHEGLGQELAGLCFALSAYRNDVAAGGEAQGERLDPLLETLRRAIALCRTTAQEISAFGLGIGLCEALQLLALRENRLFGLACEIDVDPAVAARVPAATAYQLYQIVQESLRNAARHGRAVCCVVSLQECDGVVELKVVDDGKGFEPKRMGCEGLGLRIMRYRTSQFGGSLEVASALGKGTAVCCRLVLDAA
jgi:PAS domain S-box-containing protein